AANRGSDSAPVLDVLAAPAAAGPKGLPQLKAVEVSSTQIPPKRRKRNTSQEDDGKPYRVNPPSDNAENREFLRKEEQKKLRGVLAEAEREILDRKRGRYSWNVETNWWECLLYPLRIVPIPIGLAVAWAVLISFLIGIWPDTFEMLDVVPRLPFTLFIFLLT